jgi:hypothetical protein
MANESDSGGKKNGSGREEPRVYLKPVRLHGTARFFPAPRERLRGGLRPFGAFEVGRSSAGISHVSALAKRTRLLAAVLALQLGARRIRGVVLPLHHPGVGAPYPYIELIWSTVRP